MKINNNYSQRQNSQIFGELKFKNISSWKRGVKKIFAHDIEGYKNYLLLIKDLGQRQSRNQNYDIWLYFNNAPEKDYFEASIVDRNLDLTHEWKTSKHEKYQNMPPNKMLFRLLSDIESLCPKKSIEEI